MARSWLRITQYAYAPLHPRHPVHRAGEEEAQHQHRADDEGGEDQPPAQRPDRLPPAVIAVLAPDRITRPSPQQREEREMASPGQEPRRGRASPRLT